MEFILDQPLGRPCQVLVTEMNTTSVQVLEYMNICHRKDPNVSGRDMLEKKYKLECANLNLRSQAKRPRIWSKLKGSLS